MYTEQKGHQTFIIHSVRKVRAATPPAYLQLLSLVEFVGYHQDHRKIHRIKEVRLEHPWQSIPFDRSKSSVVTCLAEICSKCITTADPHPELFTFLHDSLVEYDMAAEFDRDFMIRFMVSLSQFLGFGLDMSDEIQDGVGFDLLEGQVVRIIPSHDYLMTMNDFQDLRSIMDTGTSGTSNIALETRRRIVDQLVLYFQLHIDSLKELHSLKILRELQ